MSEGVFARTRFARGPDRRTAGRGFTPGQRQPPDDRRHSDLEWLTLFRGTDLAAVARAIGHCDVIAVPAGISMNLPWL